MTRPVPDPEAGTDDTSLRIDTSVFETLSGSTDVGRIDRWLATWATGGRSE